LRAGLGKSIPRQGFGSQASEKLLPQLLAQNPISMGWLSLYGLNRQSSENAVICAASATVDFGSSDGRAAFSQQRICFLVRAKES
jgi:hypothetical protein